MWQRSLILLAIVQFCLFDMSVMCTEKITWVFLLTKDWKYVKKANVYRFPVFNERGLLVWYIWLANGKLQNPCIIEQTSTRAEESDVSEIVTEST